MRSMALIALMLTVGCADGAGPSITDTSDTDNCPDGLGEARSAGALVTAYLQNGLGMSAVFDSNATLASGQPAACISSDRNLAQWVLSIGGQPGLVFRQSTTTVGTQTIDGTNGSVTLEIIGVETVDANEWSSGTWYTDVTDGTLTSSFNANALTTDGGTYTLTATFEAMP